MTNININPHLIVAVTVLVSNTLFYRYLIDYFSLFKKTASEKIEILLYTNIFIFIMTMGAYKGSFTRQGESIDVYIPLLIISIAFAYLQSQSNKIRFDLDFVDFRNKRVFTSFANPKNIIMGSKWSDFDLLIKRYSNKDNGIFIDIPVVDESWRPKIIITPTKKEIRPKLHFRPQDFTKTILCIGKMGSGKTVFFYNILDQNQNYNFFDRAIIHDVKGDFVERFYDEEHDYIYNPFDRRGAYFDIWEEMKEKDKVGNSQIYVGKAFVSNLFHGLIGKEKSNEEGFWDEASIQPLMDILIETHFKMKDATSSEKWENLLNEIKIFKNEADNNTDKSLAIYLSLAVDVFSMLHYQSTQDLKRLSLTKFLNQKGSKLYFTYGSGDLKQSRLLYSSLIASITDILLAKRDNDSYTLMLLDEYLSLDLDTTTRKNLLTAGRSKGICNILGIQYVEQEKVSKQLTASSAYATFYFQMKDGDSLKDFTANYGKVKYFFKKAGYSGKNKHFTDEQGETDFLPVELISNLQNYQHLTVTDKNDNYLGYTPELKLKILHEPFLSIDTDSFEIFKIENKNKANVDEFEELEYTYQEKKRMFKKFLELPTGEDEEALAKFVKYYSLEKENLDIFFEEFYEELYEK
jgi:hypothetical protein